MFQKRTRGTIYTHARWGAGVGGGTLMLALGQAARATMPCNAAVEGGGKPLSADQCLALINGLHCSSLRSAPLCSEEEELTFFSVFNQAVAHVVQTLGVRSLQFHDYHGELRCALRALCCAVPCSATLRHAVGVPSQCTASFPHPSAHWFPPLSVCLPVRSLAGALSIAYLPPQIPVRAMLVAHNADYNGSWPVWTAVRAKGCTRTCSSMHVCAHMRCLHPPCTASCLGW